jgi:heme exporter protein C
MKDKLAPILAGVGGLFILAGLYGTFFVVPTDHNSGYSQHIFYFHVPVAETSFIAILMLMVSGIAYLVTRKPVWDVLGQVSAEVGFFFGILVMVTGIIWDKAAWGEWWRWEPRLTTYLILLVLIGGYFLLRSSIEDEQRRARFSAVFGIIAALDVPVSFFSIRLLQSAHPVVFGGSGGGMDPVMLYVFIIAQLGMLAFAAALMIMRTQVELARQDLETVKQSLERVM